MRPYILSECHWKAMRNEQVDLIVLPWGATEAHGYHLPYGTDVLETEAVTHEAARLAWEQGTGLKVLPALPFGVNTGQRDILLDLNILPSTQMAILNDLLAVAETQGIPRFLLVNGHGGNAFKPLLRELGMKYPSMMLGLVDWFRFSAEEKIFEAQGDHADEMETSLMLHLFPDTVLPKEDWGRGRTKAAGIQAMQDGFLWMERPWSIVTEDTGSGDPSAASAEKGRLYFESLTAKLAEAMTAFSKARPDSLYLP